MDAPESFAVWMAAHEHKDKTFDRIYRYHPRSDAHSIPLCGFIKDDLMRLSPVIRAQASSGEIAYGINLKHTWPNGKKKTLDLAIGRPSDLSAPEIGINRVRSLTDVFFACEAKAVMTEHSKSQPRVYDELSSSHQIVHQGRADAIAAGITVINIAPTFISPLRQKQANLYTSLHRQPRVAQKMIDHLRRLPVRDQPSQVGFDAYCSIVIDCDNQARAVLCTDPPAPQPGDNDHYLTFIDRIICIYADRFATLL